jgi:two-component system, chemotaxis family, chemotaxis protein CheY
MAKKIIVIDDSSTVREQVGLALTRAGYRVVDACDGLDGLKQIELHKDAAMVICDVNMPNMSGVELIENLKAAGKSATLPVLMLTTEGDPGLIDRAKRAGAKGWIVKPFKPDLLVAAVRKLAGAT